jgi:hypothetical protein
MRQLLRQGVAIDFRELLRHGDRQSLETVPDSDISPISHDIRAMKCTRQIAPTKSCRTPKDRYEAQTGFSFGRWRLL